MRVKRLMDIGIAVVAVLLASPLLLATAILIKATSPGPIFFRQRRIGLGGQKFTMFKFRSMRVGVDPTSLAKSQDPRVTRLGKWLRTTAIDELPQLINVVRGEMSVVGPRPAI